MAGVAVPELAGAVGRAGGLGILCEFDLERVHRSMQTGDGMSRRWDLFVDRAGVKDPDMRSTVLLLAQIPYGRLSTQIAAAVIREWRGTSWTKHLLLDSLFRERWPWTELELWHRVNTVTRELARSKWGDGVADSIPREGVIDVHTYAMARLSGDPFAIDVTFPVADWDGHSSMEVAAGLGKDHPGGVDRIAEKQRLVALYCNRGRREPFIAALSSALGPRL